MKKKVTMDGENFISFPKQLSARNEYFTNSAGLVIP